MIFNWIIGILALLIFGHTFLIMCSNNEFVLRMPKVRRMLGQRLLIVSALSLWLAYRIWG